MLRENPFTPLDGELIVYDPDSVYVYRRIKFGDGVTNVVDLPFADEQIMEILDNYVLNIDYENTLAFDVGEVVISL